MSEQRDLALARNGDTAAFERLVTPCEPMLWRLCWQLMGTREDAQDAAQEAMLKAWRSLGSYRGDAAFSTWLYQVATRCCLDALRRRKRSAAESVEALQEEGYEPRDTQPLPEEEVARRLEREALRRALNSLPDEQRVPLVLCAVEGRSYEEAAAALELPLGTVKSRVSRAREQLRKILAENRNNSAAPSSNTVKGGRKA